jgi:hypothetical protein
MVHVRMLRGERAWIRRDEMLCCVRRHGRRLAAAFPAPSTECITRIGLRERGAEWGFDSTERFSHDTASEENVGQRDG